MKTLRLFSWQLCNVYVIAVLCICFQTYNLYFIVEVSKRFAGRSFPSTHLATHCSYYLLCVIVSLSAILSDDLPDEYFIRYYVCCLPKHVMDDWKLKTPTVVRIERSNKTFVYFVFLSVCLSVCLTDCVSVIHGFQQVATSVEFGSSWSQWYTEVWSRSEAADAY